ncbi:unnamed protein product [Larinioides sclopetarius]|uniref:Uncharacterized protein n=1 Tax=Larinioides sclopetarius TaxID=280406 RepID=A0AAV2BQ52_9ARAC
MKSFIWINQSIMMIRLAGNGSIKRVCMELLANDYFRYCRESAEDSIAEWLARWSTMQWDSGSNPRTFIFKTIISNNFIYMHLLFM